MGAQNTTVSRATLALACAAALMGMPLRAASPFEDCIAQQTACQNGCGTRDCVQRCADVSSRCMARITSGSSGGGGVSRGQGGIKPFVPPPRGGSGRVAGQVPKKCIALDTTSTHGVSFMVNRCDMDLSVSYCFTEGNFLPCREGRTGHLTVGAHGRQSIKVGRGVFRVAYDFRGRNVSLCRSRPDLCGGNAGTVGSSPSPPTSPFPSATRPLPVPPLVSPGFGSAAIGPGGVSVPSGIPARQSRVCRGYRANGQQMLIPQSEIDLALASGMIARKECFVQACRYYRASGQEVDMSGASSASSPVLRQLGLDPARTRCERVG